MRGVAYAFSVCNRTLCLGLALLGSTLGCGGNSSDGSGGTGSGGAAGSGGQIGCNALALVGSPVAESAGVGTPPAPQGGTLLDGTYVLVKWEVYSGTPGATPRQITSKLSAGKAEVAVLNGTAVNRANYDVSTNGTLLSVKETCPGTAELSYDYTATPTELRELFASASKTEVATYAKQ